MGLTYGNKGRYLMNIRSDAMYTKHLNKVKEHNNFVEEERKRFKEMGLDEETSNLAIQPAVSLLESLKEDLQEYEQVKRGEFKKSYSYEELGNLLVAYRVYKGLTQAELGEKMNTSESQVSRDERNEYFGASVEKILKIIKALELDLEIKINI